MTYVPKTYHNMVFSSRAELSPFSHSRLRLHQPLHALSHRLNFSLTHTPNQPPTPPQQIKRLKPIKDPHRIFQPLYLHSCLLRGARDLRNPADAVTGEQFDGGKGGVQGVDIVERANFDDLAVAERGAVAVERAAAVAAEVRHDLPARVGHLGNALGRPRQQLEARARDDDVRAIRAARDLAAVEAVAERLR